MASILHMVQLGAKGIQVIFYSVLKLKGSFILQFLLYSTKTNKFKVKTLQESNYCAILKMVQSCLNSLR